ncbi:MAG: hypothetical protein QOG73_2041, partial [Acetobacteraceae bacterium]|nr:hypothetical protein [Acetobacteraceae bacterium]
MLSDRLYIGELEHRARSEDVRSTQCDQTLCWFSQAPSW